MEKEKDYKWYVTTTYGCTWCDPISEMRRDYCYDDVAYFETEEEANLEVEKRQYINID